MRRISILYREIKNNGPLTCKELLERVNDKVDPGLQVCKSTIEKDLFKMQMDFDVELISSRRGYKLDGEIDFIDKVVQYFDIQV
jgi:hypothetical protein